MRLVLPALLAALLPLAAAAQPADSASTELRQAAARLAGDYRQQQQQRLAKASDRDSRIAALLLSLPADGNAAPDAKSVAAAQQLASAFPQDELALYLAALVCQLQADCHDAGAATRLSSQFPANALHWLLRPARGQPDAAQLGKAAAASAANPHFSELFSILDKALSGQPAPGSSASGESAALADTLRADALDAMPQPHFAAALQACKADGLRNRCTGLGQRLFDDTHGSILSRTIGSVLLRRLAADTPQAAAARQFRRDYVWLSEQTAVFGDAQRPRLQQDLIQFGEWQAWQRAAERAGLQRTPPANWQPRNPQALLLSEERSPPKG
jgi:hypothetical protein